MSRHKAIVASFAILFGVAVALFLLFSEPKTAPKRERGGISGTEPRLDDAPRVITERGVIPKEESKEPKTVYFFGKTIQIPPAIAEQLKPLLLRITQTTEKPREKPAKREEVIQTTRSGASLPKLTPEQVFHILYPDFVLDVLRKHQETIVRSGILPENRRVAFKNEEEVMRFYDLRMTIFLQRELITLDEYRAYLRGRQFLFERPYEDKYKEAQDLLGAFGASAFRQEAGGSKMALFDWRHSGFFAGHSATANILEPSHGAVLSKSASFVLQLLPFYPETAHAQVGQVAGIAGTIMDIFGIKAGDILKSIGLGSLGESLGIGGGGAGAGAGAGGGECSKSGGGGGGGKGGANFVATCCTGCEEYGIACLSTCPGAAIWDKTTLICGCNY